MIQRAREIKSPPVSNIKYITTKYLLLSAGGTAKKRICEEHVPSKLVSAMLYVLFRSHNVPWPGCTMGDGLSRKHSVAEITKLWSTTKNVGFSHHQVTQLKLRKSVHRDIVDVEE